MICPQASFDELIAQSLSHLQQVHQCNIDLGISDSREYMNSYHIPKFGLESIDEFLAHYRHEEKSIRDFIACLEDPFFSSVNKDCDQWIQEAASPSIDSGADIEASDSGAEMEIARSNTRHCTADIDDRRFSYKRNTVDHLKRIEKAPVCRRARRNMTAKEKEERRRNQNREAQRRFREKHMFLSCRDVSGRPVKK